MVTNHSGTLLWEGNPARTCAGVTLIFSWPTKTDQIAKTVNSRPWVVSTPTAPWNVWFLSLLSASSSLPRSHHGGRYSPENAPLWQTCPTEVQEEHWILMQPESIIHPPSTGRTGLEGRHITDRLHLAGYFPSITALACPDPIVKTSYLFYHYMLAKIYCTKSAPTIIIVQKTFAVARLVLLFIRHSYYILAPNKAIQFWHPGRQQVLWIKPESKDFLFTFLWLSLAV